MSDERTYSYTLAESRKMYFTCSDEIWHKSCAASHILNECSRGSPCFVAMIYADAAQRLEIIFASEQRGKIKKIGLLLRRVYLGAVDLRLVGAKLVTAGATCSELMIYYWMPLCVFISQSHRHARMQVFLQD